jgi:hypothetical protein
MPEEEKTTINRFVRNQGHPAEHCAAEAFESVVQGGSMLDIMCCALVPEGPQKEIGGCNMSTQQLTAELIQ